MEKKIGLYICKGCSIGESVDIEKLTNIGKNALKIPVVKSHFALCGKEGIELINNDINNEGVNTIVLAACSSRVKHEEFNFPGCIVERSPLRELAVWTQESSEDKQLAAEDYMKMYVIKAQKGDFPEPYLMETVKTVLVIGGGISGMTAALQAANLGYDVVLVEKEPQLGGFVNKLYKIVPSVVDEYSEPLIVNADIEKTIKEVQGHSNIKVYKSSKVEKIDGQPGAFDVTITSNGSSEAVKIGSVVLAAGWRPYDAAKLEHLGYGKSKNVVTNIEFEEIAKKGSIVRPSDGKEAKKVAFVQCAGQRDPNHLSYCSAMCCTTSLKQARYVRQNPDATAMILYKDIRTPGRLEYYYKAAQDDVGVMLTKGDVIGVNEAENGNLYVEMENSLFGEKVNVEADLVVLATGIVPATLDDPILNLQYRLGAGLPDLELFDGFADSNFICFQYETRRTGIYAAGCVRQPMSMVESQEDASGAALKAIQVIEHVTKGVAVHPRAWDTTYPDPFMQRCTLCKRCTEECPFGAIDEDEKGTPFFKPGRCRRCATCMGSCPERIVNFKDYHVDLIGSMLKNVSVPDEDEDDKFRVIVFVCENDAYPAIDTAALNRTNLNSAVRFIQLRCLGSMNLVWVADALSRGIDGMLLIGCKFGDDYQCHFAKGSELADYRLGKVQETLNRLVLESERVQMVQLAIDEYDTVATVINDFVENVREAGPNPFRGF